MKSKFYLLLLSLSVAPLHAEFSFSEKDGMVSVKEGEKVITALRTDYRVPYLYPLIAPDGANIARHWPMENDAPGEEKDHPHHRGLWLSHGDVNGYDFWAGQDGKNASIKLESITDKEIKADSANFTARLIWTVEGSDLLAESRSHSISHPDAKTLRIDITSTLTALQDKVEFGDTKEGTFAIRTDRTLRVTGKQAKATLTNSNGETNSSAWGKRAEWAAYSGPDEKGENEVVAIIDDPSSFRSPTYWHAREYGLLAANPFGIHHFEDKKDLKLGNYTLAKGASLTLKYTVIIHQGSLESANLDGVYKSLSE